MVIKTLAISANLRVAHTMITRQAMIALWTLFCVACTAPVAPLPASPPSTVQPTAAMQSLPPTAPPAALQASTASATAPPVEAPLVTPATTPLPRPSTAITGANASQIVQLARWGDGIARAIVYAPDGRWLAIGTLSSLVVYDAHTFAVMWRNDTGVMALADTPDSQTIVSAVGLTVEVRRIADGSLVRTFTGHTKSITAVAVAPDGQTLVSGADDETAKIWRINDGALLHELPPRQTLPEEKNGHGVAGIVFAPNGKLLAVNRNNVVELWRTGDWAFVRKLGTSASYSMAFSPDSTLLALGTAGISGVAELWRVADGERIGKRTSHRHMVDEIAFSPDGNLIATAYCGVQLANVRDGTQRNFTSPGECITDLAFAPDGQALAIATEAGVALYRVSDATLLHTFAAYVPAPPFPRSATRLTFGSDGTTLVAGTQQRRLRDGMEQVQVDAVFPSERLDNLAIAPDGRHYALYVQDGSRESITIGLAPAHTVACTLTDAEIGYGGLDTLYQARFSPDGTLLATSSFNGDPVHVWELTTCRPIQTLQTSGDAVAISVDNSVLAVSVGGGAVEIWRIANGKLLQTLALQTPAAMLAFSHDGSLLAVAGDNGVLKLVQVADGAVLRILGVPSLETAALAFSPDGSLVVTVDVEGIVRVWGMPYATIR